MYEKAPGCLQVPLEDQWNYILKLRPTNSRIGVSYGHRHETLQQAAMHGVMYKPQSSDVWLSTLSVMSESR